MTPVAVTGVMASVLDDRETKRMMAQKQQRPLLNERGMHLTTVRGVNQMRGTCPVCGKLDKPLHRNSHAQYWCATCVRTKDKKKS